MEHPSTSTAPLEDDLYQSDIVTGAHGDKYQKDLALAIFERATRKGYDFKLGYEMAIADKFDDVAFFNKMDDKWTLIQTKHADTSKGKSAPLKLDMLFPSDQGTREKGDFSLFKYLKSYMTVQDKIKGQKNVIIFTNRELLMESVDQTVELVPRKTDEILCFTNNTRQIGFKATNKLFIEMINYVNRDFISLRNSIVKFFKEETMDQVLMNFKTPVASILTKTDNYVKFSENLSTDAYQIIDSLSELIDIQTAQLPLHIGKDIFNGQSRNRSWPLRANFSIAQQFFQDLTLFYGQPDDLREIVDQDLRLWMRTWIRPDFLLRLEEPQLAMNTVSLDNFFNEKKTLVKKSNDEKSYKNFLKLSDGEEFFVRIKQDLEKQVNNLSNNNTNNATDFYINRQIQYTELSAKGCYVNMTIHDEKFVDELFNKYQNQRLLLLTAEPGMGKSTILEYIALAAQQNSRHCIYLFHLNTFEQKLSKINDTDILEDFLSILQAVLSEKNYCNLRNTFKREGNNRIHLMIFDALDEISPQNRDKVLEVFKQILTVPNTKILVSARKTVRTDVENLFGIKTLSLVPFNKQNQTSFLRKFWKVQKENDNSFRKYVTQIFNVFHSDINRALYESAGLPLLLKMVAEVYSDHFEEYINSKQNCTNILLPQSAFSIINLYEQFVRKSFANKMKKKFISFLENDEENDPLLKKFTLEHQLLAIKVLQIKSLQFVCKTEAHADTFSGFEKRLKNGTEKSALAEAVDDNITFVHRSYAEFLIAMFLCDNIEKCDPVFKQNSKESLFNEYPMIKILFFAVIKDRYDRNLFETLGRHCNKNIQIALWAYEAYVAHGLNIIQFLLHTSNGSKIANRLLCVAAEENNPNLCTYLFNNYRMILVDCIVDGNTPLQIAAKKGHINVVKFLMDQSANVNEKDTDGNTALHFAVRYGHSDVCKIMIEAKNNDGKTALHLAARWGRLDILQLLIKKSADIEVKDENGWTPLHHAALLNEPQVVKLLINKNADIEAKNIYSQTPLHLAARRGHLHILQLLIQKSVNIEAKDKNGETPLHQAADGNESQSVTLLINNNANIEAKNNDGNTPLYRAAGQGHLHISQLLLEKSANINAKEKYGRTPLHIAALLNEPQVVKLLINKNADIKAKNNFSETPLHYAAENGHSEVVELLIANSADIDAKDLWGKTPLQRATEKGHTDVVKILTEYSKNKK